MRCVYVCVCVYLRRLRIFVNELMAEHMRRNALRLLFLNFIFFHPLSLGSLNIIKAKVWVTVLPFLCLMCHELPSGDHRRGRPLVFPHWTPQTAYRRDDTTLLANL